MEGSVPAPTPRKNPAGFHRHRISSLRGRGAARGTWGMSGSETQGCSARSTAHEPMKQPRGGLTRLKPLHTCTWGRTIDGPSVEGGAGFPLLELGE